MSAQLPDRFLFQGREYDVVSSSPAPLFNPTQWGLEPASPHGACLRGTIATFDVKDDSLYLSHLHYWTRKALPSSLVAGKAIKEDSAGECPGYFYGGINALLPWSGQIVLGRSFLWPLLLPRGFQPAWKYKEVLHLLFAEGTLQAFGDVSKKMACLRADVMETVQAVGF